MALLYICEQASDFTNGLSCRDGGTTILRNSNHLQSHMLLDYSSAQGHWFHFHSERQQKTRFLKRNQGRLLLVLRLLWVLDVGEKINFSYPKRVCISISIQWLCLLPFCFNLLISYLGTLFVISVLHWITSISFLKQSKWPKIAISWRTKGTTSSNLCSVSWKTS